MDTDLKNKFLKFALLNNLDISTNIGKQLLQDFARDNNTSAEILEQTFYSFKKELDRIKNLATEEREIGFGSKENFWKWYLAQPKKCAHCGTDEDTAVYVFNPNNGVLLKAKDRGQQNGYLQIDRINPNKGYNPENCVLACILCNHSKSDLFDCADKFQPIAKGIREFYDNNKKITKQE